MEDREVGEGGEWPAGCNGQNVSFQSPSPLEELLPKGQGSQVIVNLDQFKEEFSILITA